MGTLKLFLKSKRWLANPWSKRKAATDALPPQTPRVARWLRFIGLSPTARQRLERPHPFIYMVLCALVALIGWGAWAQIDQVVRVEGKIIPAGRSREIQHLEGGIIAAIHTVEGATVKKGELLLTIDDAMAGSNLGATNIQHQSARAKAIRLRAEAEGAEALTMPAELAGTEVGQEERALFASRREQLAQRIRVHDSTIREQRARLAEATKRRANLVNELAVARKRSGLLRGMMEKQAASQLELLEAQSREQRLQTELSEVSGTIPTIEAMIAGEEARIETVRAEFRSEAQRELVTTLADADRLQQLLLSANDRVNRTELRAPESGVINRIAVNTVGGVIKPGASVIELIPTTHEVLIEARSRPQDRGYLQPGLKATIRLTAYDVGALGVLTGKVTEVSADTVEDAKGNAFYRVNILASAAPSSYHDRLIVPGMTASADIVTRRRTAISYLLSPLRKFTYSMFRDAR